MSIEYHYFVENPPSPSWSLSPRRSPVFVHKPSFLLRISIEMAAFCTSFYWKSGRFNRSSQIPPFLKAVFRKPKTENRFFNRKLFSEDSPAVSSLLPCRHRRTRSSLQGRPKIFKQNENRPKHRIDHMKAFFRFAKGKLNGTSVESPHILTNIRQHQYPISNIHAICNMQYAIRQIFAPVYSAWSPQIVTFQGKNLHVSVEESSLVYCNWRQLSAPAAACASRTLSLDPSFPAWNPSFPAWNPSSSVRKSVILRLKIRHL